MRRPVESVLGAPLEITTVLAPPPVDVPLVAPRPDVGSIVDVLLREPMHVDVLVRTPGGDRILGVEVESSGANRIVNMFVGRP